MKFRRLTALMVGAAIMAGSSTAVFAESVPQTAVVEQQLGASATKTWDGKSALEAGQKYVLKKSVTLSKKVEIPKGTTLTLNKGVKLGIGAKGSLYIRGTLSMKSGSTLSVSGKLYTYSGSKISNTGAIKLNTNKANVTIGGALTVNKGGSVSGTPKSIKLGKNAKVTIKGSNTCKKLAALLGDSSSDADIKDIENMINGVFDELMSSGSMYNAIGKCVPAAYLEQAEKEFAEQIKELDTTGEMEGMTMKDLIDGLFGFLVDEIVAGVDSLKASVAKVTDCTNSLTEEQLVMFASCKNIEKAYNVEFKTDVKFKEGYDPEQSGMTISDDPISAVVVKADGQWYLVGDAII
ncbi:MAG: hypothetical protein ACI4WS_03110 [Oscillospiraceae bacterium]